MARRDNTTADAKIPARIRALATTVHRGLTSDFECNHLGDGIYSVRSIGRTGGITLTDPRVVDVVGNTCTCEGFMHMRRCKHLIAALRRANHANLVDTSEIDGMWAIRDGQTYRTIEGRNDARAVLCFLSHDDALRMPRDSSSTICPLDATALDCGYDGIGVVVGKYLTMCWNDGVDG